MIVFVSCLVKEYQIDLLYDLKFEWHITAKDQFMSHLMLRSLFQKWY